MEIPWQIHRQHSHTNRYPSFLCVSSLTTSREQSSALYLSNCREGFPHWILKNLGHKSWSHLCYLSRCCLIWCLYARLSYCACSLFLRVFNREPICKSSHWDESPSQMFSLGNYQGIHNAYTQELCKQSHCFRIHLLAKQGKDFVKLSLDSFRW